MQHIKLISEMREEYQIPPFFTDTMLETLISDSMYYFQKLYDRVDFDIDRSARELLKVRVFYAYNKRLDEFAENYANDIVRWQMQYVKE